MKNPYWWALKPGFRRSFAEILRYVADRIGPEDAFTATSMTMYLCPTDRVWKIDANRKVGVPIYNRRAEYDGRQWDAYPIDEAVDILFGPKGYVPSLLDPDDPDHKCSWTCYRRGGHQNPINLDEEGRLDPRKLFPCNCKLPPDVNLHLCPFRDE